MTKRLFYTCPIQALYMQLNFHVHLYFETKDGDVDFNPQEYADNVDLWLSGYNGRTKIYVESESEHTFEPKEGDEGRVLTRIGASYCYFKNEHWVAHGMQGHEVEIIMRDNKQFFQAEVENENSN